MIIKDNFLNGQQLATVNQLIEKDITKHGGRFERYDDEVDHHETDDCNLFYLNHQPRRYKSHLIILIALRIHQCYKK